MLLRVTVEIYVDVPDEEYKTVGDLEDVTVKFPDKVVRYNGKFIGKVYDWTTENVEELSIDWNGSFLTDKDNR